MSLRKLVSSARCAQAAWCEVPVSDRGGVVLRFADALRRRAEECALTLTRDTGKPLSQSMKEVKATVVRVEFFAKQAAKALKTQRVTTGPVDEEIVFEPLGVVANISAWNYPYFVGSNVWAPALVAGNAVIYKPSEYCAHTGLLVENLWKEAGLPKDLFTTTKSVSKETGRRLVDEEDLDMVCFTGSAKTGQIIAEKCGPRMIKTQLELGGKDAAFVCDDVEHVKKVAQALADGAFYNTGQSCCSIERIYVQESIYDDFSKYFVEEVESFHIGSEWAKDTYLGPLTLKNQVAFLEAQVQDALEKGATLLTTPKKAPTPRHFPPTVLANVTQNMDVHRHESFGPLVAIAKVTTDEKAIDLMNDSSFGLTAAVYSSKKDRALAILKRLKTGTAYWNCCDRSSPSLPWQGRNLSGIGITMSHLGIQAMTIPRAYHLNNNY